MAKVKQTTRKVDGSGMPIARFGPTAGAGPSGLQNNARRPTQGGKHPPRPPGGAARRQVAAGKIKRPHR